MSLPIRVQVKQPDLIYGLILTTNLPFSEWGKIFTGEQLAAAIIDRGVHYGHMINTGNKDWRLVNSPMNRKNNR